MSSDSSQLQRPQQPTPKDDSESPESQLIPAHQPQNAHAHPGTVFKTRFPSACKECRRRKQKCSLTQPCTNCARRFPQPACEYGLVKPSRSSWTPTQGSKEQLQHAGAGGFYSHLDMESVHDALLDVEGNLDLGIAVDTASGFQTSSLPITYRMSHRKRPTFLMEDETWAGDELFQIRFRDKSGLLKDSNLIEMVQFILQTRLRVANRIVKDEWEIDGEQLVRTLQTRSQPSQEISTFEDQVQRLPMAPTKMNKELVRTHLQLLSRFKASLDGSPRPKNRFMKHWIPYSVQDQLVLHVVLCTTASFLHETGRLPKILLHLHRATATKMLNEYIGSPTLCTSDSAMLAVCQLILTSWYWSSTTELHAHMAGFKKMIDLRGGCQDLGMEGYTAKLALINDAVIALCHDTKPVIFGQPGCEFEDPVRVPLQVNFNSPLLFNCPPFLGTSSSLRLHSHTIDILDKTRLLLKAVFDLRANAAESERSLVTHIAASLLSFIDQLPANVALESDAGRNGDETSEAGQKRKRKDINDQQVTIRSPPGDLTGNGSPDKAPDMVYLCVRETAQFYARAIYERKPISEVCTQAEFIRLWSYAWAAGLGRWSNLSGIYAWMNIAVGPMCHETIHARMVKTLTVTTFTYMGTENWHVAADIAEAALKVQAWLRSGDDNLPNGSVSAAVGGEKGIENFGFAFKDNMPDLPDHRK